MESFNDFLTSPLGLAAAGVAAFVIGSLFFNVKQWEAHWKQWAIDTSKAMSKAGLIHTPKILDCLAVGDLAGAFREIKSLADIFKDPKQLAAEFETVFQNMLEAAFKDPAQAKALQQLANDAVAAFASGDPTQAASQLATDAQAAFRRIRCLVRSRRTVCNCRRFRSCRNLPAIHSWPASPARWRTRTWGTCFPW